MGESIDDLTRLAMFEIWDERCTWCFRPLFFNEMEVEHLIPKGLTGEKRDRALVDHGRHVGFDLDTLENMAPSCGPCNRGKGAKPPPNAPIIALTLERADGLAPKIREQAQRFRENRNLTRSLNIVLAAVDAGNQQAIAKLREAADSLSLEMARTGGAAGRLHSALHEFRELGDVLKKGDAAFFYTAASHAVDAPAPGLTPGSVLSLSETADGMTSRVDVVPRDEDALARYGPQFSLIPTEDEAGVRARAALETALKEGNPITIDEGLQVVPQVMPPALNDWIGRPIAGQVQIGRPEPDPHRKRPAAAWNALMRASSQPASEAIHVLLKPLRDIPDGWETGLAGAFGGLTVTALFQTFEEGGGQLRWNFTHTRDDSPVRQQLAALEFLDALSRGGELVVTDIGPTRRGELTTPVPVGAIPSDGQALLAFLRDVRAIETWTRTELPLPDKVPGAEARQIALLADAIRRGGRSATWSDMSFELETTGVRKLRSGGELGIEHEASARLFGREIPIGRTRMVFSSYKIASVLGRGGNPPRSLVRLVPTDDDAADIFERLLPPGSAKRPPPPPPKKAARARKNARRRRRRR